MSELSPAQRLRQIAEEMRRLPETLKQWPGDCAAQAGELLSEAIDLGAFADAKYAPLRTLIARQKRESSDDWQTGAWAEAVTFLLPELDREGLFEAWESACGPIADFLDAEVRKMEALAGQERPLTNKRLLADADAGGKAAHGAVDDNAYLSPATLAELFCVPRNALEQRLKRWRAKNHDGWIENQERKPREPKYTYLVKSVKPIIDALRATGKTTGERPAKKD